MYDPLPNKKRTCRLEEDELRHNEEVEAESIAKGKHALHSIEDKVQILAGVRKASLGPCRTISVVCFQCGRY